MYSEYLHLISKKHFQVSASKLKTTALIVNLNKNTIKTIQSPKDLAFQGKESNLAQIPSCRVTLIMIIQSSSRWMAKPITSYWL